MTSPSAIVTSALATTLISLLAASIVTSALPPEIPSERDQHMEGSSQSPRPFYKISPIPAGADWARS
jgi:hypothetical protein